uniref:hypothetical protein n=1 Tax=Leptospira alexanderi TaxID=100053 RepID=UPI00159111BC
EFGITKCESDCSGNSEGIGAKSAVASHFIYEIRESDSPKLSYAELTLTQYFLPKLSETARFQVEIRYQEIKACPTDSIGVPTFFVNLDVTYLEPASLTRRSFLCGKFVGTTACEEQI